MKATSQLPAKDAQWNPGDLALCVRDDWDHPARASLALPVAGRIYQVEAVMTLPRRTALGFGEFKDWLFGSSFFRKVRPDTDPAADNEVTARIRRCADRGAA